MTKNINLSVTDGDGASPSMQSAQSTGPNNDVVQRGTGALCADAANPDLPPEAHEASLPTRDGCDAPTAEGRFNWADFYRQQAALFRDSAARWRETETVLRRIDDSFADFAAIRAAMNEVWADEAERAVT